MAEEKQTFNKGDQVPEAGEYICVPCGYKHAYHPGETFGECTSCLAGSADGDPEFVEGSAIWEKIGEPQA